MELDRNLLKEFAKITNDSEVKSETKYLRGTIVKNSGGKYVQLDGSTTVTPIAEIVDVDEGDRVLVSIENHKATILGNFTFKPSARNEQEALKQAGEAKDAVNGIGETINLAEQQAKEAKDQAAAAMTESSIASALANEAKQQATEALESANTASESLGVVTELAGQAKEAADEAKEQAAISAAASAAAQNEVTRIQGEVNAAQEDINKALEDLEAQGEDITILKETYATKVEVEDTKAELETTITAKVGELQASVSETYSTKNETVELEGKLQNQITLNTEGLESQAAKTEKLEADTREAQQRVNEAIAAAGEAESNAFAALALAEMAEANAKIAEEAATNATEKAAQATQTAQEARAHAEIADAALASARTNLNEAQENFANVSSNPASTEQEIEEARQAVNIAQETVNKALEDVAEAEYLANKAEEAAIQADIDAESATGIANKARIDANKAKEAADKAEADALKAQQDVAALTKRVTNAETVISQNSEQILLNANKTTEIGKKLDDLEIGGRNYLRETRHFDGWTNVGFTPVQEGDFSYVEAYAFDLTENDIKYSQSRGIQLTHIKDKPISISFEMKVEDFTAWDVKIPLIIEYYDKSNFEQVAYSYLDLSSEYFNIHEFESGKWVRIECKIPADHEMTVNEGYTIEEAEHVSIRLCLFQNGVVYYRKPKLEIGTAATDWSPAPEDIENELVNNYYSKTETDAKFQVQSDRITSTVTQIQTVETTVNNWQVGGRNYIRGSRNFIEDGSRRTGWQNGTFAINTEGDYAIASRAQSGYTEQHVGILYSNMIDYDLVKGKTICISLDAMIDDFAAWDRKCPFIWELYDSNGRRIYYRDMYIDQEDCGFNMSELESGVWTRLICLIDPSMPVRDVENNNATIIGTDIIHENVSYVCVGLTLLQNGSVHYRKVKLELGNEPTDWSPAPEDTDTNIANVENGLGDRLDELNKTVTTAQSSITQLATMISNLVTDANGGSLMTQTSTGWTFNMSSITSNLKAIQDAVEQASRNDSNMNTLINGIQSTVNALNEKTAYVNIGTDSTGSPCILLGKIDNPFKVRITNTAIDFLQGSNVIAYANNNTFYAEKMIVKNELQIGAGPGFVWRTRPSGNLGLVYISG